ncbi:unnamed protein product [Aureobasidium vineae]|uniref:Uncharacterized protein n=1 Tax=Aureobasidium vineae TaxID=2773715 RepID=A0A9N8JR22_9PEZI|nr:unnamed protein product [Aureobasidium vineae]
MTSPKDRRRSSLSAAFDHFRNKCRKTRIDSLLSPPKLDSGTSNDEEESSYSSSDSEGVPLTAKSGNNSHGDGVTEQTKDEDDNKTESTSRGCDSKLPDFNFEDCSFSTGFELGAEDSDTSPDEDKRLLSALADFNAEEATEVEDFSRYFPLSHRQRHGHGKKAEEKQISPTGSMDTRAADASSLTNLLHSDNSGSTLDFEVGVPLQRTVARANLQQEWTTQIQTEPQTQEQSLARSTYASLDEVVRDTVLMKGTEAKKEEEPEGREREREVSVVRTVDGVRLDARPLIRHSGTAAPPHSSLQLHTITSNYENSLDSTDQWTSISRPVREVPGARNQSRPQLTSWFSSSSESSVEGIHLGLPSYRRRSAIEPHLSPAPAVGRKRHQTTLETRRSVSSHIPASHPSKPLNPTSVPRTSKPDKPKVKKIEYSHTPPSLTNPPAPKNYTTLSSASSISAFHSTLNAKLNTAISTGAIKANQVSVKERVRRLSGARSLQQGWEAGGRAVTEGARRMSGWGRGIGEAVVASGGVGVDWAEASRDGDGSIGARSAGVHYGGGFV